MIVRCVRSICSRTGGHGPARALLIIRKQATPQVPMQKLSPRAFRPELVLCGTDYHKATRRHKSSIEAGRDVGAARAYLSPPLHTFHLVQLSILSTLYN